MIKEFISLLITFVFLLSQPLVVFAQPEAWQAQESPSAGGLGFFEYRTLRTGADEPVYFMRGPTGVMQVTRNAIWLTQLEASAPRGKGDHPAESRRGVHLKITFPGASSHASLTAEQRMPGHVSILSGNDPSAWAANLPLWGAVRYNDLLPGVDLVIRSTETGFTWELETQTGADASGLRLHVQGANGLKGDAAGALAQTDLGELRLPSLVWKGADLSNQGVSSAVDSGRMEIRPVGEAADLTALDPSAKLAYSTFLGGSNWDVAHDVAVDSSGAAYLVGETASIDFPTTPGAFDASLNGTDVFAVKLTPGASLSYATYIGGSSQETGWSVAVENGVAYIGGETSSTNFPVTDATNLFAGGNTDAFALALNGSGTGLVYSRLLGGTDDDRGYGIAVESGAAYLTGITYSSDFPGGGNHGSGDVFVVKLNANGTINYALIDGGNQVDAGFGIAVRNGAAWVTGQTWSGNFAGGVLGLDDAFVMNLSTSGTMTMAHTYGGLGEDDGEDITVSSGGDVYITGLTRSSDFPFTEGVFNGVQDAYLLKVSQANTLVYATPLGGSGEDEGKAVVTDALGGVIVTGMTQSTDFPVTSSAYQTIYAGNGDGFITRYLLTSTNPGHRAYSSFIGGIGHDESNSVGVDASLFAYLTGYTQSANYPTTSDGLYRTLNGTQDAFLSVIATGPVPTVTILKTTNNEDAHVAPGPYVPVGNAITWRYNVTNTGEVAVTNIKVTDDKGVSVTCPKTNLAPAESMTCSATGTAVKGQYSNLGIVTADTPYNTTVSDADVSHYFGADPKSELVKKTNGSDANSTPGIYLLEGSNVNWTYEVTNSGNVDLTNVQVVDDNGTPGNSSDDILICTISTLAAGATDSTTCHLEGTAQAGQYTNIAVVTGTAPDSLGTVTDNDPSNYFGSAPALTLVKKTNDIHITAAPGPYLTVGSSVTWKYELQNTGNVPLTNVNVVDDRGTTDTGDDYTVCTGLTLAPNATDSCTWTGTAAAGQYHNSATATGTPPVGSSVTAQDDSFYFGAQPAVALEYSVNSIPADMAPGLYALVGDPLALEYRVTNTGNVPLTNLTVVENAVTLCTIPSLDVSASSSCTRNITAQTGQKSASATVTATPPGPLTNVTATDEMYYFGASPTMTLVKKTNNQDGETAPGVYLLTGSTVNWSYTVTNTGNVALSHVTVVDDNGTPGNTADDLIPAGCGDISLGLGASVTCTLSATAQTGQYTNASVATASPPDPLLPITASDTSNYFGTTLSVSLVKQTNNVDADTIPGPLVAVGAALTWTYRVTNNSNVPVDILVVDDNGTPINTGDDITVCTQTLAAGAETTCTHSGTAAAGQYANTAVVTATPPGGLAAVTAQDTSHYFGVVTGVSIVKKTNGQDANEAPGPYIHVGDVVSWTYRVTNTGNVVLNQILVTDDRGVAVTCPGTTLAPSAWMDCTASGISTAGQYVNTGTVIATPPVGFAPVTASDVSHYFGSEAGMSLVKLTNSVDAATTPGPYIRVGQPVTWTYVVTNTGNVAINNIAVADDQGVTVTCPVTTLAPAEHTDCTASGTAVKGQYSNLGTATADPVGDGGTLSAVDTSYYFGAEPSIQIVKKTNGQDANEAPGPYIPVGETISYSYELTNTSTWSLSDVTVTDGEALAVDCPKTRLNANQTMTCSASGVALIGQRTPSATVQATAEQNLGTVTASDVSHYYGYQLALDLVKKTNGVHAANPPGPTLGIGFPVTWTYELTNQSNVPVTSVTVSDSMGVSVTCPKSTLNIAEKIICAAYGVATEGQYTNLGQARAEFNGGSRLEVLTAQDFSYYFGIPFFDLFLPLILR